MGSGIETRACRIVLVLIRGYRYLSPIFGYRCRFTPSCSEYAIGALEKYGFFKGIWMSIKRLGKCNPFFAGGYDPVK